MKILSNSNNLTMPKMIGNRYVFNKVPQGHTIDYSDSELLNIVVRGSLTKFKSMYTVVDDTVETLAAEQVLEQSDIKVVVADAQIDADLEKKKEEYLKALKAKLETDGNKEPSDKELWQAADENAYQLFGNKKHFLEKYHELFDIPNAPVIEED